MRVNQLEEQLSNTLKAVDSFHEEMKVFKEYLLENSKVVNGLLRKLDDHQEEFDRNHEFLKTQEKKIDLRFQKMEERFQKNDQKMEERFEKNDKKMEERFQKSDQKMEEWFRKSDLKFQKSDEKINSILKEMESDRKLREAQFELVLKKFEKLES